MKVYIVEASYPKDFFRQNLDGLATHNLLLLIGIKSQLRMVLNRTYLKKAIREALRDGYDVLHLSCHGDDDGIALPDDDELSWEDFSELFPESEQTPVLIMSSCKGAATGIAAAFSKHRHPPPFIFGSEEALDYDFYAAAWSLLYRRLWRDGVNRDAGQHAIEQITAVLHHSFIYRRWDKGSRSYLRYPIRGERYVVSKKPKKNTT